jgi:cytochrome c peroxidase
MRYVKLRINRAARRFAVLAAIALIPVFAATIAARADDHSLFTTDELASIQRHTGPVSPPADLTNKVADDPRAARFGQFLFFDNRLSSHARFSCASCHQPEHSFTDGRKVAKGVALGTRNTPTLLNAADNHWFFWDGRADTMWSQVLQVIENPREFGGDRLAVVHAINDDPALDQAYTRIFGALPPLSDQARFPPHASPIGLEGTSSVRTWAAMSDRDKVSVNRVFSNAGKALAAYERRLVSHGSPFDRYAHALQSADEAGEAALTPAAKRGLKLFVGAGQCDLCHSGADFTDGQFHNVGLPTLPGEEDDVGREAGIRILLANPFNAAGPYSDAPHGQRAQRVQFLAPPEAMLGAFKTPTLRNIALTGPYFHDGRFATLGEAVKFYADGKIASRGRMVGMREATLDLVPHFTPGQIDDLVAFLKTLNSPPLPEALIQKPVTP